MIVPVRCFTCGKLLCDKWEFFVEETAKEEDRNASTEIVNKFGKNFDESAKGKILDRMGLDRMCCRRHMLGHVDLIDNL